MKLKSAIALALITMSVSSVSFASPSIYGNTTNGSSDKSGAVATGGIVNIDGGNISASATYANVYGSFAGTDTAVTNGTVNIKNATIDDVTYGYNLAGGYNNYTGATSAITGNSITIDNTTFSGEANIYGGCGVDSTGTVSTNSATIKNITTSNRLSVMGGFDKGSVNSNTVNITDSQLTYAIDDTNKAKSYGVFGGKSAATVNTYTVNGNITNITGSTVGLTTYGGFNVAGTANGNTVNITKSTVGTANYAAVYGGYSMQDNANNNIVKITDSTINGRVYGSLSGEALSSGGSATDNTITINNSTINGDVKGSITTNGASTGNTINLTKAIINGDLFGGDSVLPTSFDTITGNTLNVYGNGNSVKSFTNFQKINFYASTDTVNNSTMLTVTGGTASDMSSVTNLNVGVTSSNKKLKVGDTFNLISNTAGISNFTATTGTVNESDYKQFATSVAMNSDNNKIVATVTTSPNTGNNSGDDNNGNNNGNVNNNVEAGTLTSAAKSPVETAATAVSLVNSGSDTMTNQGFSAAATAVSTNIAPTTMAPFAVTGAANQRLNSGSHVDSKGVNIAIGFAKEVTNNNGKLMFGPTIEYGRATYDSYLDSGYHASGNTHYYGIGLMAKQTNNDNTYYEGSIRYGKLFSDYTADSATGGKYDSTTKYIGFHIGTGKIIKLNNQSDIDVYGKYFLTHQFGYNTTMIANGRNYNMAFDATNSNRIRLGARYNYHVNNNVTVYTGLAWQYEFNSENTCTIDGLTTPSPSMKGHTGYVELGITSKATNKFEYGINLTGNFGKSRGIGANVSLLWKF